MVFAHMSSFAILLDLSFKQARQHDTLMYPFDLLMYDVAYVGIQDFQEIILRHAETDTIAYGLILWVSLSQMLKPMLSGKVILVTCAMCNDGTSNTCWQYLCSYWYCSYQTHSLGLHFISRQRDE